MTVASVYSRGAEPDSFLCVCFSLFGATPTRADCWREAALQTCTPSAGLEAWSVFCGPRGSTKSTCPSCLDIDLGGAEGTGMGWTLSPGCNSSQGLCVVVAGDRKVHWVVVR